MAVIAPPTLDDLGLQGCLALAALLMAAERRLPVAPTRRLTLVYMGQLRELGVIEAPWPEGRWDADPTAEVTPLEQIQWRYCWSDYIRTGLLAALEDFLREAPRDDYGVACRMRLWQELGAAEAECFLEAQLLKYNLDGSWAQDLVFAVKDTKASLPIAQWRYCAWAAVRYAAAQAQRYRGTDQPLRLREDLYAELRRRAARLGSGDWAGCAFAPFNPTPESAASRLLTTALTDVGPLFWTALPTPELLVWHRAA